MPLEQLLISLALLLILATVASKISTSLGIPSLVFFIVIGVLAGSEGPGNIEFWDPSLAQSIGTVALSFILFSGGLDTSWSGIRPVLVHGLVLSTLGVAISAVAVAAFVVLVAGFSPLEGLLLGAIVSSTDAAAVFSVLRSKGIRLRERLKSLLELESGSNDPMAIFLTMGLTGLLANGQSAAWLIPQFFQQMLLGAVVGYLSGRLLPGVLNRLRLDYEGLYPVFTIATVLLTYGGAASVGGNGFLSVYVCGIVAGTRQFVHKKSLMRFHDGLGWLVQIAMFLSLGLLVFPSQLVPVIVSGSLVALFLILVARPLSVHVCLAPSRSINFREKAMIAWVGLRGAVPIVLATFPLVAGVEKANTIFNMVFFIVVTSVVLQGPFIPLFARLLGVETGTAESPGYAIDSLVGRGDQRLIEFDVGRDSSLAGQLILNLGLPPHGLIVLIHRGGSSFVPNGGTAIESGDRILVLVHPGSLREIESIFGARGHSPRV